MNHFESSFAKLLECNRVETPLLFDLDRLIPAEIRSATREEVQQCLAAYKAAETLMPDLLTDAEGWHSLDVQARCRKVIERFLGGFRIRLHWITPQQPLGYHKHGVIDVIGVKEEGYTMDVGFSTDSTHPPKPALTNLNVIHGSVYVMQPGMWHELRHRSTSTPSISLNVKQHKKERESRYSPLPRQELEEKLKYFGSLMGYNEL